MRARLLLAGGLAAALAGCGAVGSGGGDFEGTERDVADAIERLQPAGPRDEAAATICRDVLTSELARRLAAENGSCEREMSQAIADADFSGLAVTDVSVRGDAATAQVESASGQTRETATIELRRERGDWRVASIRSAG